MLTHLANFRSVDADREVGARVVHKAMVRLPEVKHEFHVLLCPYSRVGKHSVRLSKFDQSDLPTIF